MKYILTMFAFLVWLASPGQVQLSTDEWKAVEGIYRNGRDSNMNLQFEAHRDTLFALPLWGPGRSITLLPKSPLEFHGVGTGEGGNLQVLFKQDATGKVIEAELGGAGTWVRNDNYKPLVRTEMRHTPDQIRPFEGFYQLEGRSGMYLKLSERNNRLILKQLWDGNELPFVPETASSFFMRANLLFTLEFAKDEAGHITDMVAFKTDHWKKIDRAVLTLAALQKYEGRYQSKDDPDNQISIIARDSGLVVKQAWDGKETAYAVIGDTFFYNEAAALTLELMPDANGKIREVKLFGNSVFTPVVH